MNRSEAISGRAFADQKWTEAVDVIAGYLAENPVDMALAHDLLCGDQPDKSLAILAEGRDIARMVCNLANLALCEIKLRIAEREADSDR